MEIKVIITADEKALEFARDIARSSSKLGIIGDFEEIKEKVKTAVETEIQSEDDRPWETIEPDPIKVEPVETPEAIKKYSVEEIRAAGAEYMKQKGKVAFKAVLKKFNIEKLPQLAEEQYAEFMAEVEHA